MAMQRDAPVPAPKPLISSSPRALQGHSGPGPTSGGRPRHTEGGQGLPQPHCVLTEQALGPAIRAGGCGRAGNSYPHAPVPARSLP